MHDAHITLAIGIIGRAFLLHFPGDVDIAILHDRSARGFRAHDRLPDVHVEYGFRLIPDGLREGQQGGDNHI
ncbi:MAG: hypothetical protein SA339_02765 [Methanomassiliicoccus sp.]|nr:hypothetical protein [Methanomassiliicoccus sp.]